MSKHSGHGKVFPPGQPERAVSVGYMYEDWPDASQHSGSRIGSGKVFNGETVKELSAHQDLILQTEEGEELRIEVGRNGDLRIIAS